MSTSIIGVDESAMFAGLSETVVKVARSMMTKDCTRSIETVDEALRLYFFQHGIKVYGSFNTIKCWHQLWDQKGIESGTFEHRANIFLLREGLIAGSLPRRWKAYWNRLYKQLNSGTYSYYAGY